MGGILSGTPPFVWGILAGLVFLGARRLRTRRAPLALAAAAPIGFAIWTVFTLLGPAPAPQGARIVVSAGAALIGFASGPFRLVPRPVHLGGGVFELPATRWPLLFYMLIFWTRYMLEMAGHLDPARAATWSLIATALMSLAAGRALADFLPLARAARHDRRRTA
jgi:hypothetical protein